MFSLFNQYQRCFVRSLRFLPEAALIFCTCATSHVDLVPPQLPDSSLQQELPKHQGPHSWSPNRADTAPTAPKLRNCTLYSTWWLWCHISRDTTGKRGPPSLSHSQERDRQKQPGSGQHMCYSNPQPDWKVALSSDKFQNEEINTKCGWRCAHIQLN